jgi:hypothetical protein
MRRVTCGRDAVTDAIDSGLSGDNRFAINIRPMIPPTALPSATPPICVWKI